MQQAAPGPANRRHAEDYRQHGARLHYGISELFAPTFAQLRARCVTGVDIAQVEFDSPSCAAASRCRIMWYTPHGYDPTHGVLEGLEVGDGCAAIRCVTVVVSKRLCTAQRCVLRPARRNKACSRFGLCCCPACEPCRQASPSGLFRSAVSSSGGEHAARQEPQSGRRAFRIRDVFIGAFFIGGPPWRRPDPDRETGQLGSCRLPRGPPDTQTTHWHVQAQARMRQPEGVILSQLEIQTDRVSAVGGCNHVTPPSRR